MRRIGRWMLNGVTALSLMLCVATCVLWARSYWARDVFVWGAGSELDDWYTFRRIVAGDGGIAFHTRAVKMPIGNYGRLIHGPVRKPVPWELQDEFATALDPYHMKIKVGFSYRRNGPAKYPELAPDPFYTTMLTAIGFQWARGRMVDEYAGLDIRSLTIPLAVPVLMLAVLPTIALRDYSRRRAPARSGGCPSCRYNLTGNISGVCPECGMKIAEAK